MYDDEYFENKKEYFTMGVFEFENGGVLENVSVEYMGRIHEMDPALFICNLSR